METTERPLGSRVQGLGHVGLYVFDLDELTRFWTEVMEFVPTDGSVEQGFVFLSADPSVEHHMLLLRAGRTAARDSQLVQQVSFRCADLDTVVGYRDRLHAAGVATMDVSHGNAVGVYFDDPDGNRCEVYWATGMSARQVFKQAVDLDADDESIMHLVRGGVDEHGAGGVRDDVPFTTGTGNPRRTETR